MANTFLLGIDVGASDVKAVCSAVAVQFPSAVAPFSVPSALDDKARRGAIRITTGRRVREFLYGELGLLQGSGVPTVHGDYRLEGDEVLALYLAAILELTHGDDVRARCVVGVPAAFSNNNLAKDTLAQTLSGRHSAELLLGGNERKATVQLEVLQVMSQPNGTVLNFLTDVYAVQQDAKAGEGQIAVLDIGAETTDVARLTDLVVDRTDSLRYGTRDIERAVAAALHAEHNVELEAPARRRVMLERAVWVAGVRQDVTSLINKQLALAADVIVSFFLSVLKTNGDELRYILLTGGGAKPLAGAVMRRFPQTRLVTDPVLSNAQGFYKKAVRLTR